MTVRINEVTWMGMYQPGVLYHPWSFVQDGGWAMMSNKATSSRPAPQPVGGLYWVSGLGDTPAWESNQVSANLLVTGQRYTTTEGFWIVAARMWVPAVAADRTHALWLVTSPSTNPASRQLIGSFVPTATGWVEIGISNYLVLPNSEYDLVVFTTALGTPDTNNGYWQYKQDSGGPSEGEIWHQDNNYEMRVHYTDKNDINQQSWLDTVTVGGTINAGGQTWEIYDITYHGSHIRFYVTPAYRIDENEYTFTFNWTSATTLDYVQITNHYPAPLPIGTVQGYYSATGYDPADSGALNTNAYGADIQVQQANVSEDWEFVAFSG